MTRAQVGRARQGRAGAGRGGQGQERLQAATRSYVITQQLLTHLCLNAYGQVLAIQPSCFAVRFPMLADAQGDGSIWTATDTDGGFAPGSMIAQSGYDQPRAYAFKRGAVIIG